MNFFMHHIAQVNVIVCLIILNLQYSSTARHQSREALGGVNNVSGEIQFNSLCSNPT